MDSFARANAAKPLRMMTSDRKTTIERAFDLAATGRYRTVTEVRTALRQEHYEMVDSTLAGRGVREQLKRVMTAAREAPSERQAEA